jgi:hypothetical protein
MAKPEFFVVGLILIFVAACCFNQNKFTKYYDEEYHTSTLPWLFGVVGVLVLVLAAVKLISVVVPRIFRRKWVRCLLKVLAYTISALIFFFTFKVGPKAQLFHDAHTTVASLHSSSTLIKNTSDFLVHSMHQKPTAVFIDPNTVTDLPTEITQAIQHVTKTLDEIKNLTNTLDLQFTGMNHLLFLDIWTLLATSFMTVSFLFVALSMNETPGLIDWLFDLFCDLVFNMAVEIFTMERWYYAFGFYIFAVVLVILKEAKNPIGPVEVQNGGAANVDHGCVVDPAAPVQGG